MERKRNAYKMKYFNTEKITLLFRIILGVVFIYASIDKIINPLDFSNSIDNYNITPVQLNNLAALIIPWIELIVGLCLVLGILIRGSSVIVILLLLWFIFILSQALYRGINLDCGCFNLLDTSKDVNLRFEMFKRIAQDIILLFMVFYVKRNNKW